MLHIAIATALLQGCRTPMPPGAASGGRRFGPLFETAWTEDGGSMLAVRPFYSREETAPADDDARLENDILWPLGVTSRRGTHSYWRAALFYGTSVDGDPSSPEDPWRFRLFPLVFAGRTQDGEGYGAVFPLGGTIREFLFLHDFSFILFPIYGEGKGGGDGGVETRTVLWPFYLTRHGERIDQFRLWPFYGESERRGLHSTRRNRFVAWPFWSDSSSSGEIEGSGFVLFPIFGHSQYMRERRGLEESWSVVPPFFQYGRGDDGYRKVFAPWPFVRLLDNDGVRERHVWPLWGKTERFAKPVGDADGAQLAAWLGREYLLWPFCSWTETHSRGGGERVVHLPMPFYFHRETYSLADAAERVPPGEAQADADGEAQSDAAGRARRISSYTRLWPLFSHRAAAGGDARVRVPELSLWSKSEQVERNWAPLWSLYTYRRKSTGAYCNDILWGLVSWGRNDSGGAIFSLLWIPFAK